MLDTDRAQAALDQAASVFEPSGDCWLASLDYTVHYDTNWILDASFRAFGNGAYPETHVVHVAIDLRTGTTLTAHSVFVVEKLPSLLALVRSQTHKSWSQSVAKYSEILQDHPEPRPVLEDLDNFIVRPDRLVFLFDFQLPHVIAVATPTSEFPVTRAALRPFLRADGPLRWLL